MMASDVPKAQGTNLKWLYLILLPFAFLLKDVIATVAILSTEPGITSRVALFYKIALLPGGLFFNAIQAMLINVLAGIILGWLLYRRAVR